MRRRWESPRKANRRRTGTGNSLPGTCRDILYSVLAQISSKLYWCWSRWLLASSARMVLALIRLNSACACLHCWSSEAIASNSRRVDCSAQCERKNRTISWIALAVELVCGTCSLSSPVKTLSLKQAIAPLLRTSVKPLPTTQTRNECSRPNHGAPPRSLRCRSFSSASSLRTRVWRQRDPGRLSLPSEPPA